MREIRFLKATELRAEKAGDGKQYLTGYAAPFNTLSEDLGGWKERIAPGAFTRALGAGPDVRHLINHDPSKLLGRTKAKTTELWEDEKGLAFRTLVGTRSYELDLAESIARGDIDGCSFCFKVNGAAGQKWDGDVRELRDLDLYDVSVVTYPAYPGTTASLRSMFPFGMPAEIRSHVRQAPTNAEPLFLRERTRRALEIGRDPRAAAKKPSFRASVLADGTLELLVYEDIGLWWDGTGVSVKTIKEKIDSAGIFSRISVRINSPGGDAFEGIAIHNLLRAQGKPIECAIDGLAASAASVIAMCGDTIVMGSNAMMMIHNVWSICVGDAADMREQADTLDKITAAIAQTYVDRTGQTPEHIKALMDAETWMSAAECLAQGFATAILPAPEEEDAATENPEEEPEALALARSFRSLELYSKVPECFKPRASKDATEGREDDGQKDRRRRLRLIEASL